MNRFSMGAVALAVGMACSAGVMAAAETMSKDEYKAAKTRVEADYKAAKAACASLSGNAKDVCEAEAKGKETFGMAELEARNEPTAKRRYEARVARAEADYAVAKERCDDKAGNDKDVCVKEAKAAEVAAKADAKTQMKDDEAKGNVRDKTAGARTEAAEDKAEARYKVAKEKCDTYSGSAKDACLDKAKAEFGK